jgi:hypothetical protein
MKKQLLLFCAVAVFFVSCMAAPSVKTIFDESVPLENTAWLSTTFQGTIVEYNGIPVKWEKSSLNNMIQIPAGDTLLKWDINAGNLYVQWIGKGILFQYSFQPRKQYIFLLDKKDGKDGFDIWRYDIGEKMSRNPKTSDKQHYVEFVPFLNTSLPSGLNIPSPPEGVGKKRL